MTRTTVHLTNAYHPTSGGIRTFYNGLLEAGNRVGRRVVLVVPAERTSVEAVGALGRIYRIRAPRAPVFDRQYRLLLPHRYFPAIGRAVIAVLEREAPGVVEICDKYSLPYLAAMLRRRWHRRVPRPALVGLSSERFDDNMSAFMAGGSGAAAFTQWYIRHIYGPPFDAHLAVSDYAADELTRALWDRAPGFVRVCPPGFDGAAFGPSHRSEEMRRSLLARAGGDAASTLLFYAGRLSPEKNVPLLVEMLRDLVAIGDADYRLVMAGNGPLAETVLARAGALASRVALVGACDRASLARCLASADVFVHPNAHEPFGIGPLEAMASAVPVVLPNRGGVLQYASTTNAWLAPPTSQAFATAVRDALGADRCRIANAVTTAARFELSTATHRYFEIYDELEDTFARRARASWSSGAALSRSVS